MGETETKLTFAIPFLGNYGRMAEALANSIRWFHPGSDVLALTTAPAGREVRVVARRAYDELLEFDDPGFDAAGYSAVVWTRLHLWDLPSKNPIVCLDADIQMYRALPDEVVASWQASGRVFGSFLDGMTRLEQHFTPDNDDIADEKDAPAACVAYLLLQPQPGVTDQLVDLAAAHDGRVICPEQAILNLYAARSGGWLDQSASTVTQSWSPAVIQDPPPTPFVHFGSPRPSFFGPSPLRQGDPEYDVALARFERETGQSFPVERFQADFQARLADLRTVGSSGGDYG